jgi:ABC-type microcin C transport system permease subunit YejB
MKKFIFWALVLVVFIVGVARLQQYTINGVVAEDRGSSIIVEDVAGFRWCIEVEAFTFREGDSVTLTMKEKGTTSRDDDEVVNIQPIAE